MLVEGHRGERRLLEPELDALARITTASFRGTLR